MTDASRVKELRTALEEKHRDLQGMSGSWKDEDGKLVLSTEEHAKFTSTAAEAKQIRALLDAESMVDELGSYLSEPAETPTAAGDFGRGVAVKSLSDYFIDSPEYVEAKAAGFSRKGTITAVAPEGLSITQFGTKDISRLSGGTVAVDTFGRPQHIGLQEKAVRQFHVRDLFPRATTRAPLLYGVRETGYTTGADVVTQRNAGDTDWSTKPDSTITFTPVQFPVATIAHHITVHRQVLEDEPRLRSFIEGRMVDGVMYKEDSEMLFGAGGAEKITGIFNTVGVQTYAGLWSDKKSVQVRRAATQAFLAEYEPTGVVVHPTDFEEIEVEETNDGAFRVAVSVAIGAEKRLWRMNVVETTAMTADSFLVGAFGMGAMVYDRELVSVQASSEHGTNFTQNLVTMLCEERVALEVSRPESFVAGTFTDYVTS